MVRCWWISGVIGRLTPAIAATWRPHIPAALITISARTRPRSVTTAATAPPADRSMPVTRTPVSTATPSARARRASSVVAPLGSIQPSPGQVHRPVEVVGGHEREQPERLRRRDRVDVEAEGARRPHLAPEEEPLVPARRDPEAPDLVPVLGRAGLGLEAPVEADRVLPHAHDRGRRVEVRHHPRGVPRRPARQLALVEEQDVGPPLPRQVVGDAAAGDAAADDDDPRLVPHAPPLAPREHATARAKGGSRSRARCDRASGRPPGAGRRLPARITRRRRALRSAVDDLAAVRMQDLARHVRRRRRTRAARSTARPPPARRPGPAARRSRTSRPSAEGTTRESAGSRSARARPRSRGCRASASACDRERVNATIAPLVAA